MTGTVYLLHFSRPYVPYPGAPPGACARHYTGFAGGGPRNLRRRLAQHGTPAGANIMRVIAAAGITWTLARTWPGDRARERQLKRQGSAARYCPLCGVTPRPGGGAAPGHAGHTAARPGFAAGMEMELVLIPDETGRLPQLIEPPAPAAASRDLLPVVEQLERGWLAHPAAP